MKHKIIAKITASILLCSLLAYTTPVLAATKEETVYSKINTQGSNYYNIVVSDEGNQKVIETELPIECKVTYELDEKPIEPQELAGKSGKVKITIEYTNKDEHIVKISGKNEKLYTPFVAICGTIIDNENNKNIQITNGKIVNNGNKTIVVGMAFPGMQESLDISKDKIEIPNIIEITMNTTNFELSNMVTYVTPKILEDEDLAVFDKLDEMYSQLETLQSSSKQLVEGAQTLQEGTKTYTEKSQEFNQAMKQVANGANSATQNYNQINSGISKINQSSKTLQEGSKSITEGTKAISSNLNIISEKLGELQTGSQTLLAGQKQLSAGIHQIIATVGGSQGADNSNKITELETLVSANKTAKANLETANKNLNNMLVGADAQTAENLNVQIEANKNLIKLLENNITANEQTIATLKQTDMTSLKELQTGLAKLETGINQLEVGTQSLYAGQTAMKQGVDTLVSKTQELTKGTDTLYQGTTQLAQGTKTLDAGSKQMQQGLKTLDIGAEQLLNANNQLLDGSKTISEGATTLSNGITKFDKEGIQVIYDAVNGDLKNIKLRIEKLQDLANEYSMSEESKTDIKFIIMMDSIKKEENNKEQMIIDNKEN